MTKKPVWPVTLPAGTRFVEFGREGEFIEPAACDNPHYGGLHITYSGKARMVSGDVRDVVVFESSIVGFRKLMKGAEP